MDAWPTDAAIIRIVLSNSDVEGISTEVSHVLLKVVIFDDYLWRDINGIFPIRGVDGYWTSKCANIVDELVPSEVDRTFVARYVENGKSFEDIKVKLHITLIFLKKAVPKKIVGEL